MRWATSDELHEGMTPIPGIVSLEPWRTARRATRFMLAPPVPVRFFRREPDLAWACPASAAVGARRCKWGCRSSGVLASSLNCCIKPARALSPPTTAPTASILTLRAGYRQDRFNFAYSFQCPKKSGNVTLFSYNGKPCNCGGVQASRVGRRGISFHGVLAVIACAPPTTAIHANIRATSPRS